MTALQIIKDIQRLKPMEKARVIPFVRALDDARRLSGAELTRLADQLALTGDTAEADRIKEEIAEGFYGTGPRG